MTEGASPELVDLRDTLFGQFGVFHYARLAALAANNIDKVCQFNDCKAALRDALLNERLRETVNALGGGCEANDGGLHSAMKQGKEWFCPDCGLMLKRVTYVLPHVKPAETRKAIEANTRSTSLSDATKGDEQFVALIIEQELYRLLGIKDFNATQIARAVITAQAETPVLSPLSDEGPQ